MSPMLLGQALDLIGQSCQVGRIQCFNKECHIRAEPGGFYPRNAEADLFITNENGSINFRTGRGSCGSPMLVRKEGDGSGSRNTSLGPVLMHLRKLSTKTLPAAKRLSGRISRIFVTSVSIISPCRIGSVCTL